MSIIVYVVEILSWLALKFRFLCEFVAKMFTLFCTPCLFIMPTIHVKTFKHCSVQIASTDDINYNQLRFDRRSPGQGHIDTMTIMTISTSTTVLGARRLLSSSEDQFGNVCRSTFKRSVYMRDEQNYRW